MPFYNAETSEPDASSDNFVYRRHSLGGTLDNARSFGNILLRSGGNNLITCILEDGSISRYTIPGSGSRFCYALCANSSYGFAHVRESGVGQRIYRTSDER